MNRYFKIAFPVFFLYYNLHLYGQQTTWKNRLYFEGNVHYGFVMPHITSIAYFVNDHVTGYQLNIGLTTSGEKKWHQYYNYPRMGLGFYHSGLGNDQVFGKINALFFYFDRFYFKHNRLFNLGNRISFGLGYVSKKFDLEKNYFDDAIGSKLNVYINYSLEGTIRLTPLLHIKLGLGFSHTSNGRVREPNKGLNLMTSFAGIQYSINDPGKNISLVSNEAEEKGKNQFLLMGAWGQKQISQRDNNMYSVLAFSAEYARKISRRSLLGLALNTYYDPSLKKESELAGDTASNSDYLRLALNLSYELKMGRLSYIFQPGIYVKNPFAKSRIMSNRIGVRYQFGQHWLAGITIKAHWLAIADFIEWGVGYRFIW